MSELKEEEINNIRDLFEACKIMQKHGVDMKGLGSVEDAKCRLLRYIRETTSAGNRKQTDACELLQSVLHEDKLRREQLSDLYSKARDCLASLPRPRRAELNQQVPDYVPRLQNNLTSVQRSDCTILIAGEVSAGKSSLLNLLLGENLLPTSLLSCTSVICELRYSVARYAVAHPVDPTRHPVHVDLSKEDAHQELSQYVHNTEDRTVQFMFNRVEIYWPLSLLKGGIVIVDSPGIGESREMTKVVKDYLTSAFAFIYVINSSNAGGLQPDRLQDLLSALVRSKQEDETTSFDPRSAIFVCNKWDQIPPSEMDAVRRDTETKLSQCWPGLASHQIFYFSTTQASRSLAECGFVTSNFSALLEGIEELLPISLQCKLECHYRWLSQVLRRAAFVLRVHIANESRSDSEREELVRKLCSQMDHLEAESKAIGQSLQQEVRRQASEACDQLVAHLASASTRARLLHWGSHECPDGDDWESLHELQVAKVHKRIRKEVSEWDLKNNIFTNIQKDLMKRFQEEFKLMEDQLDLVEGDMIGTSKAGTFDTLRIRKSLRTQVSVASPALTFSQKLVLGLAAPVLVPIGVVAGIFMLPLAGLRAIRTKLDDMRALREYRDNKTEMMASLTDSILETFLEKSSLKKLVEDQLSIVLQNVQTMVDSVPKIVEADRAMMDKLLEDRKTSELSIANDYTPIYHKCLELQGKLDLFYASRVRHYDVDFESLEWDPVSPPVASGSFGDVYKAKWKQQNGEVVSVAMKIPRETLDIHNVTSILLEEEVFRRIGHENIVKYLGTSIRRSNEGTDDVSSDDLQRSEVISQVQVIILMELCVSTLRSHLPSSTPPGNPGCLQADDTDRPAAVTRIARYGHQITSALEYLHCKKYVHRDLKPNNILVCMKHYSSFILENYYLAYYETQFSSLMYFFGTWLYEVIFGSVQLTSDDVIKLADVGHTRKERDISGTRCGTGCYTAPEIWSGLQHGYPVDIFSFGILLWELWYGKRASDEVSMASPKHRDDPETAIMLGTRPSLGTLYEPPEDWKDLIRRCWNQDPQERPTASECVHFFLSYN